MSKQLYYGAIYPSGVLQPHRAAFMIDTKETFIQQRTLYITL